MAFLWRRFIRRGNDLGFPVLGLLILLTLIGLSIWLGESTVAEVGYLYPESCLGSWQYPERAQGQPEGSLANRDFAFSDENSAIIQGELAPIFCGQFDGEMPDNGEIASVRLRLSLGIKPVAVAAEEEEEEADWIYVAATTTEELATTSESVEVVATTTTEEATTTEPVVEEPVEEPVVEEVATSTPIETVSFWFTARVFAQEESLIPETPVAEPEIVEPEVETIEPEITEPEIPVESTEEVEVPPAEETEKTEPVASTTIEVVEPIEATTTATTSDEVVVEQEEAIVETVEEEVAAEEEFDLDGEVLGVSTTTATTTPEVYSGNELVEVAFSLDGSTWQKLATLTEKQIAAGELALPLAINDWEKVYRLQIRVQNLSSMGEEQIFYLDGLALEIEYLLPQAPDPFPQPNFMIDKLVSDESAEGWRVIHLERPSGAHEIWLGELITGSEETIRGLWNRVAGEEVVAPETRVGIKHGQLFWFDPGRVSIWSFNISSGGFNSVSLSDEPGEKNQLRFSDSGGNEWLASPAASGWGFKFESKL